MSDAIWGAIIGAGSAAGGIVLSSIIKHYTDYNSFKRKERFEAYSSLLRYIVRIRNKYSVLDVSGQPVLTQEHQKEFFDELAEVKIWLIASGIFASKKYREEFSKINNEIFGASKVYLDSKTEEVYKNAIITNKKFKFEKQFEIGKPISLQEIDEKFERILELIESDIW